MGVFNYVSVWHLPNCLPCKQCLNPKCSVCLPLLLTSPWYFALSKMSDQINRVFGRMFLIASRLSLTLFLICPKFSFNISLVPRCSINVVGATPFAKYLLSHLPRPAKRAPDTPFHITVPPPCNWVLAFPACRMILSPSIQVLPSD